MRDLNSGNEISSQSKENLNKVFGSRLKKIFVTYNRETFSTLNKIYNANGFIKKVNNSTKNTQKLSTDTYIEAGTVNSQEARSNL